ncbi:ribonuclease H2 subunit A, partial [Lates japonicus]
MDLSPLEKDNLSGCRLASQIPDVCKIETVVWALDEAVQGACAGLCGHSWP